MSDQLAPREEPAGLRASDAERDRGIERLREALGEGRIDSDEFGERTHLVLASRTVAELEQVLADLPAPARAADLPSPLRDKLVLRTTSGSRRQEGRWVVPPTIIAECASGSIRIDFTHAECAHRDVVVVAECKSGSIKLILPRGWTAIVEEATTKSGSIRDRANAPRDPGAPVLHVYATVTSGSIRIRHRWVPFWKRQRGGA